MSKNSIKRNKSTFVTWRSQLWLCDIHCDLWYVAVHYMLNICMHQKNTENQFLTKFAENESTGKCSNWPDSMSLRKHDWTKQKRQQKFRLIFLFIWLSHPLTARQSAHFSDISINFHSWQNSTVLINIYILNILRNSKSKWWITSQSHRKCITARSFIEKSFIHGKVIQMIEAHTNKKCTKQVSTE